MAYREKVVGVLLQLNRQISQLEVYNIISDIMACLGSSLVSSASNLYSIDSSSVCGCVL